MGQVTKLVSACLLGINCRYDGQNNLNEKVMRLAAKEVLIPVCPEQLGGLETPREPMGITGGGGSEVLDGKARVTINRIGRDVTENLVRGAEETLKIAKSSGVREAIFKARSPSCGCGKIHDGTSPRLVEGDGVTAALLKRNGIRVITEDDL